MSEQPKERKDGTQGNSEKTAAGQAGKAKPASTPGQRTRPTPASTQTRQQARPTPTAAQARQQAKLALAAAQARQQAKKRRDKRIMIIMIALAVLMLIIMALVIKKVISDVIDNSIVKPDRPSESIQTGDVKDPYASYDPNADPTEEPTLDFEAVQPLVGGERRSEDIFTFLIFGTDVASGLTDTMMVGTYDVTNQQATVMSLPRDTIVNNTGNRITDKKLNAVYTLWGGGDSGVKALKNEVSKLVGFVPDYYVKIDWELVGEMVDAIDGVWFDNPYHMDYYDPYQDLLIYQEQGYRKLNGNDAMQVVRWRHNTPGVPYNPGVSNAYVASDLERLEVQHTFLKAVLKQTLQIQNVFRIGKLAELFGSRVESDLSIENIFWFATEAVFGGLGVDDVNFCTMPVAGGSYYQAKYNAEYSFVYPIQRQLLTIINQSLNPYVEQVTLRQLDLMYVASDGSLQSSTGRLADPSVGVVQERPTDDPEESGEPTESGEPIESGEPTESGEPAESGEPTESGRPVQSGPPESEPPASPPAADPPEPPQESDEGNTAD